MLIRSWPLSNKLFKDIESTAKKATERVLQEYTATGHSPQLEAADSVADLMAEAGRDKYLAIMAYVHPMPEVDKVLADF